MRTSRMGFLLAVFLGALVGGCSSTEGRCEDICDWTDNCLAAAPGDCVSNCEGDYDEAGDACQEAFDDFADCLSDNDLSCNDACDGEFAKYATECIGQFG